MTQQTSAPLAGIKIIEFAGIGPGPFAGMMLADMGAEIIRIVRPGTVDDKAELDFLARGRKSVVLDLKSPHAVEAALRLVATVDAIFEGYRPGVMERLGLGPDVCLSRNPRLVYGRMTGWGQTGPLSGAAGHDLNYIALTGALWSSGEADRPPAFAMNLLGDFGGGGMLLAFGLLAGILKAQRTGEGDVVDAAICDGTSAMTAMLASHRAKGKWRDERQSNFLDGGVPWYNVYTCSDGHWVTVAAVEPSFWAQLLDSLGITESEIGDRTDRRTWPGIRKSLTKVFLSQPRAYWIDLLEGTDACFAPVLSPAEATSHPQNAARHVFSEERHWQPMPAPRFALSQTPLPPPAPTPGANTDHVLSGLGYNIEEIAALQGIAHVE